MHIYIYIWFLKYEEQLFNSIERCKSRDQTGDRPTEIATEDPTSLRNSILESVSSAISWRSRHSICVIPGLAKVE